MGKPFLQAIPYLEQIKAQAKTPLTADNVHESLREEFLTNKRLIAGDSKVPLAKQVSLRWSQLEKGEQVNAGFNGALALLAAYGTLSAASHAVGHDEDGKTHVQWSQVGLAILQAAMTAACAYSLAGTLRAR